MAICASASVIAQKKSLPPVDADVARYYKLPDGRVISGSGHYYRSSRGQVREDFGNSSEIVDVAAGTIVLVNHENRSAQVFRVPAKAQAERNSAPSSNHFGEGVVEGHRVDKSRFVGTGGDKHELWMASDIGVVVMTRAETENFISTRTLKNIRVQEPDRSIFTIPAGYSVKDVTTPLPADLSRLSGLPSGNGRQAQVQRR